MFYAKLNCKKFELIDHLTVSKRRIILGKFKNVINKMCLQIIYI